MAATNASWVSRPGDCGWQLRGKWCPAGRALSVSLDEAGQRPSSDAAGSLDGSGATEERGEDELEQVRQQVRQALPCSRFDLADDQRRSSPDQGVLGCAGEIGNARIRRSALKQFGYSFVHRL